MQRWKETTALLYGAICPPDLEDVRCLFEGFSVFQVI